MKELIFIFLTLFMAFSALFYRAHNTGFGPQQMTELSPYQTKELHGALERVSTRLQSVN